MDRLKLIVVGGGVTGLAAAHRAVELARERAIALDLTLFEARPRLGGTIGTERADGFLVEVGPDSFLSEKPWALALCRRLGVEDRLVRTDDRFRKVFVWFRGRLHPLPDGFQLLAPTRLAPFATSSLFSWRGQARMALDLALPRGRGGAGWSLFVTFADGMETLVTTLADRLPDSAVVLGQRVSAVERVGGGWRVTSADGARFDADRVILAAEAHVSARLLRYVDPALAMLLGEIEYAGAATVSLGYRRADVPHPLDGFGFVVPRSEGKALLAATFSSVKYPGRAPAGHALIRCFMGGALDAETLREDDEGLVARARRELGAALGVTAEPVLVRASRWPASMPQYRVGHLARVEAIERCAAALPSLHLAGAAYRGVGIADCVRSGEAAAEAAVC